MSRKDISFSEVDEILRIIDQFPAAEIVYERGDLKLHVRRAGAVPLQAPSASADAPAAASPSSQGLTLPSPATSAPAPRIDVDRDGQVAVESPLIGVFYAAPAPGAKPFVTPGQQVAQGDDLCIIEVMKVMNTLMAPCAGTIVDICVENAAMVQSGQALMWIRPIAAAR